MKIVADIEKDVSTLREYVKSPSSGQEVAVLDVYASHEELDPTTHSVKDALAILLGFIFSIRGDRFDGKGGVIKGTKEQG